MTKIDAQFEIIHDIPMPPPGRYGGRLKIYPFGDLKSSSDAFFVPFTEADHKWAKAATARNGNPTSVVGLVGRRIRAAASYGKIRIRTERRTHKGKDGIMVWKVKDVEG